MGITIDEGLCDGCGLCLDSCATDVLRLKDDGKAYAAYAEDCDRCSLCVLDCPQKAIAVSPDLALPVPLAELGHPWQG